MARLNPYINLKDNAREALEFYHSVFGGELTVSTFGEFGQADDPADADKVMHGQVEGDGGMWIMVADTPSHMPPAPETSNISVSLSGGHDDDARLRGYWEKLLASGSQIVPLEVAPWGDAFGMCTDAYGVTWLVNIAGEAQG
ncbi:VOC family protein [Agromyces sp. NPDC058126]|uniref:VOC family protein n=1 Tax=Agromyces sp. NPDC058126 TaxID=3346350 RepID=UPI0036D896C9